MRADINKFYADKHTYGNTHTHTYNTITLPVCFTFSKVQMKKDTLIKANALSFIHYSYNLHDIY